MRYILLMALLTGCGSEVRDFQQNTLYKEPRDPRQLDNESELWEFAERFAEELEVEVDTDMIIGFGPLPSPTVGLCTVWTSTKKRYKQITVDPEFWADAEDERKELLMYHELGHCVLDLGHSDGGVMSDTLIHNEIYVSNKEQLLKDMKEGL